MKKEIRKLISDKIAKYVLRELRAEGVSKEECMLIAFDVQRAFDKATQTSVQEGK